MAALQTKEQQGLAQSGAQGLGFNSVDAMRKAILPPKNTTFSVDIPDSIPSTALTQGGTRADVQARRNSLEQSQLSQQELQQNFQQGLAGIQKRPQETDFLSSLMFAPQTETTVARDQLAEEQRGLIGKARDFITGRSQDTAGRFAELQQEGGVPELQQRIAGSNERVAQLRGELAKIRPQIEGEAGQTRVGAEARLGPIERNLTAEIASEALVQSALVGNLNAVQSNIDKILQLEFQDEQAQLQDMQMGIQLVQSEIATLEPKLQEEANQRLAQFQFAMNERANALQAEQQNKAQVLNTLATAAQNGAPQQVLDAIRVSGTGEQAIAIAGQWMGDPLDRQLKQAQLSKLTAPSTGFDVSERAKLIELARDGDQASIDALGYDPNEIRGGVEGAQQYEIQSADIQMGVDAATALLNNERGIKSATGAVQSPIVGGFFAGGKSDGSAASLISRIPIVGNVQGSIQTKNDYLDFVANASFLVNDTTFQEIRDLKAQGVTFGNMTEGERKAAGRAANQLNAAVRIDDSGQVIGFNGSEDVIRGYIRDIKRAYEGRQQYLDIKYSTNRSEQQEAQAVWNSN